MRKPKHAQSPKPWMAPDIDQWEIEFDKQFNWSEKPEEGTFIEGWTYDGYDYNANKIKQFISSLLRAEKERIYQLIKYNLETFMWDVGKDVFENRRALNKEVLDLIREKLKPQEFYRCPCGKAISSFNGCIPCEN